MRYLRYAFFAVLAIVLVTVALANRQVVTLSALPKDLGDVVGFTGSVSVPLFIVMFAGIIAGVLIGFVWEWLREHKHRSAVGVERREKEQLKREVRRLRRTESDTKDDVLALLEDAGPAR